MKKFFLEHTLEAIFFILGLLGTISIVGYSVFEYLQPCEGPFCFNGFALLIPFLLLPGYLLGLVLIYLIIRLIKAKKYVILGIIFACIIALIGLILIAGYIEKNTEYDLYEFSIEETYDSGRFTIQDEKLYFIKFMNDKGKEKLVLYQSALSGKEEKELCTIGTYEESNFTFYEIHNKNIFYTIADGIYEESNLYMINIDNCKSEKLTDEEFRNYYGKSSDGKYLYFESKSEIIKVDLEEGKIADKKNINGEILDYFDKKTGDIYTRKDQINGNDIDTYYKNGKELFSGDIEILLTDNNNILYIDNEVSNGVKVYSSSIDKNEKKEVKFDGNIKNEDIRPIDYSANMKPVFYMKGALYTFDFTNNQYKKFISLKVKEDEYYHKIERVKDYYICSSEDRILLYNEVTKENKYYDKSNDYRVDDNFIYIIDEDGKLSKIHI